jgi:hypothetical protein
MSLLSILNRQQPRVTSIRRPFTLTLCQSVWATWRYVSATQQITLIHWFILLSPSEKRIDCAILVIRGVFTAFVIASVTRSSDWYSYHGSLR